MPEFVVVQMKPEAAFQTALSALPTSNPLRRARDVRRVMLPDLGARELISPGHRNAKVHQAIAMEHWDGVSPPVDIRDLLRGVPAALAANRGRIRFIVTSELIYSIEFGVLRSMVNAGLFLIEGYEHFPAIDHGSLSGLGDDDHTQYSLVDGTRAFTGTVGGITPTDPTHLTTKQYVDSLVVSAGGPIIVPFTYATPSPLIITAITAGQTINEAEITVETAFDDASAFVRLGTAGDPSLIFADDEVDLTRECTFGNDQNFEFSVAEVLRLVISPAASTQGSGFVLIKIS